MPPHRRMASANAENPTREVAEKTLVITAGFLFFCGRRTEKPELNQPERPRRKCSLADPLSGATGGTRQAARSPVLHSGLGERFPGPLPLCAQHGRGQEVKVLWGSRSQRPRANRKETAARSVLKEAGSETASRRTETGYEAPSTRASGQSAAKLSRPKGSGVNPAVVRGRRCPLPGETSPCA